jgi:hypothetical protein
VARCALTRPALADAFATATGAAHRADPISGRTGGPAGNARLTAWLGLVLLIGFIAEGVTLISVGHFITAHILIGALLVPLVLAKTATTGWRIVRYYRGSPDYRTAGPPPLLLRILGPLVVVTGLAVLGSGLALIALGDATFSTIGQVAGFRINALTIHQASFIGWLVVTALHTIGRAVPAAQVGLGSGPHGRPVPGDRSRLVVLAAALALSTAAGLLTVHLSSNWTHHRIVHSDVGGHDSADH